jgi:hypothetical protein
MWVYTPPMRLALVLTAVLTANAAQAQWEILSSPTSANLRGIHAIGNGIAWASGSEGAVLRTTDDGQHWQLCPTPPNAEHLDFRGIQAFDQNTAIVMSSGKGDLSRLYKTTDACHTWTLLFTNPDPEGFWDGLIMTSKNIGMLIGDPVPSSSPQLGEQPRSLVFPTHHTIDGGLKWSRNDHDRLRARVNESGEPSESIFAASNSSMLLVPYLTLFVSGGKEGGFHYEQYTIDTPFLERETASALAVGDSAGGFAIAANWVLGSYSPQSELHARALSSDAHAVVIVGGDYNLPEEKKGTASVCKPLEDGTLVRFGCVAAQTPPHGYRSSVAYSEKTTTWITVGPNGTDISTDDGRNWRALRPTPTDPPDADRNWNALSLPFVVGPHGRIGKLRPLTQPAAP